MYNRTLRPEDKLCSHFFFEWMSEGFVLHRLNGAIYFLRFRGFYLLIFSASIEALPALIFHVCPLVARILPYPRAERYKRNKKSL